MISFIGISPYSQAYGIIILACPLVRLHNKKPDHLIPGNQFIQSVRLFGFNAKADFVEPVRYSSVHCGDVARESNARTPLLRRIKRQIDRPPHVVVA